MTKKTLLILPFIFSLFIFESCTLSNRKYINGYQVSNTNNKSKSTKYKAVKKRDNNLTESSNHKEKTASKKELKVEPTLSVSTDIPFTDFSKSEKLFSSAEQVQSPPSPPLPIDPACDSVFLKNGARIYARIAGTKNKRIIFIKCNDEEETKYTINESEIAYIKKHDGQVITPNELTEVPGEEKQPPRKIEPFSLASFITVYGGGGFIPYILIIVASRMIDGTGFIAAALILAMAASFVGLIIGIIGLIRAARNKDKFRGGVLAVFAIIFALLLLLFTMFWVFWAW